MREGGGEVLLTKDGKSDLAVFLVLLGRLVSLNGVLGLAHVLFLQLCELLVGEALVGGLDLWELVSGGAGGWGGSDGPLWRRVVRRRGEC